MIVWLERPRSYHSIAGEQPIYIPSNANMRINFPEMNKKEVIRRTSVYCLTRLWFCYTCYHTLPLWKTPQAMETSCPAPGTFSSWTLRCWLSPDLPNSVNRAFLSNSVSAGPFLSPVTHSNGTNRCHVTSECVKLGNGGELYEKGTTLHFLIFANIIGW